MNLRLSDPLNPFPSRVFRVDTETGQAELVSETLVGIESLAISGPGGCSINGNVGQPESVPVMDRLGQGLMFFMFLIVALFGFRRFKY